MVPKNDDIPKSKPVSANPEQLEVKNDAYEKNKPNDRIEVGKGADVNPSPQPDVPLKPKTYKTPKRVVKTEADPLNDNAVLRKYEKVEPTADRKPPQKIEKQPDPDELAASVKREAEDKLKDQAAENRKKDEEKLKQQQGNGLIEPEPQQGKLNDADLAALFYKQVDNAGDDRPNKLKMSAVRDQPGVFKMTSFARDHSAHWKYSTTVLYNVTIDNNKNSISMDPSDLLTVKRALETMKEKGFTGVKLNFTRPEIQEAAEKYARDVLKLEIKNPTTAPTASSEITLKPK